ncbi:MAG: PaaI family thioesterase [Novosphingobium sp.]|nr:PaaI family thioesterase [Novosphingobium sp.]
MPPRATCLKAFSIRSCAGSWRTTARSGGDPGHAVSGFFVEERHCNPRGICHGGWLSTFADIAMVRQATVNRAHGALTISMAVDFLEAVPLGSWVESRCEIVREADRIVHVQGVALVDGRAVLRMNGTFRPSPLSPPPEVGEE